MSDAERGSLEIRRSRDEVWRQLTALDGLAGWYDGWDGCDHAASDQWLREGVTFRLHSGQKTAECRVLTVQEPTLLRWIEHRTFRAPVLVEFRLDATTPQSTVVTHTKTVARLRRVRE